MSELIPTQLKSSRLLLRGTIQGDAAPLFIDYFGSTASSKFLARKPYTSVEQTEEFLNKWTIDAWRTPGTPFAWVIAKSDESEPVGIFLVFPKDHGAEIHYGISEKHRGCGYASEACDLASNWLLNHSSIKAIRTSVDTEHHATQRVLEKSGFQKVGVQKNQLVLPAFGSEARDALSYSKTKITI